MYLDTITEWLQRPKTLCQKLHLDIYWNEDDPNFDLKTVEHQILSSLAGNTNLKVLEVNLYDSYYTKRAKDLENFQDDDSIKKLLCNTASIESVVQSNHFLQEFKVCEESDDDCEDEESDDDSENEENENETSELETLLHKESENETNELQTPLQQYLQLNTNPNKNKVIQAKIMQFYLSGDFEESSIKNMPLSVLAHIMGIDVQEKHSAVFNILRNVPELCSGSNGSVSCMATRAATGTIMPTTTVNSPAGISPAVVKPGHNCVVVKIEKIYSPSLKVPRYKNGKTSATLGAFEGELVVLPIRMLKEHIASDSIRATPANSGHEHPIEMIRVSAPAAQNYNVSTQDLPTLPDADKTAQVVIDNPSKANEDHD